MSKKIIRTGTTADPTGDSLKNAFVKVNDNFTELYNALGLDADTLNIGAFEFAGSVISTTDSSAIVIDQATTITSNLSVGGDILPQTALGGDLGSSTLPWRSLYVSNNTIFLGGVPLGIDASNNLTVNGSQVGTTSYADLSGKPALTTVATTGAYADLTGKPTIPTLVSQLSNDSGFLTSVGNISNIQSEGNINIDINLSDSTLRRWQFGEDGILTLPSTGKISSGVYDWTFGNAGIGTLTLPQGGTIAEAVAPNAQGGAIVLTPLGGANANQALVIYPTAAGDGDHIHLTAGGGTTELYLGNDTHYVKLVNGGNVEVRASTANYSATAAWTFGTDGALTIPGDIKSNGNINIDINLSDSTLRRWQFGEDGNLTLPTGSSIADTVGNAVIGSNSGTVSITNLEVMNFTQLAPSNYLWITNQYYSGSLLTSTFGSLTGTATGATTRVVTGVTQLSTSGRGSGAMFQVTVYYNGSSTTYTAVSIDYNGGNQQYGSGYAVGDTVTIAGASLGGTTPTNNLTFTVGNAVRNNYPAGLEGGMIYDYTSKHFMGYNGSTWTQLDNPLTPSGTKASNAYGVAGQTSFDSNYFYICIATNTWRRVALGSSY